MCAEILDLSIDEILDKFLSNKIPREGCVEKAESMMISTLAVAALNLNEKDCKRLLENIIGSLEKLKETDVFADGKKNCFDIMNKYFRISGR